MPRHRRSAHELTTDEVLARMFPKPVREQIADEARKSRKAKESPNTRRHSN